MLSRILYLLPNPIERAQVDSALPHIEFQIHKTRLALANAAENYFSAEARVSHSLETLGHALRDHPWLLKLLPQSVVEKIKLGGVVAYGVAQLAPGDFASQSTQLLASSTNLGAEADKAQRIEPTGTDYFACRHRFANRRSERGKKADSGRNVPFKNRPANIAGLPAGHAEPPARGR
jgi:hypothetical protein